MGIEIWLPISGNLDGFPASFNAIPKVGHIHFESRIRLHHGEQMIE